MDTVTCLYCGSTGYLFNNSDAMNEDGSPLWGVRFDHDNYCPMALGKCRADYPTRIAAINAHLPVKNDVFAY